MTTTATKTKKPSIKRMPVESGVEDAISYGYGVLEELRDEIAEVVENMSGSEGLTQTSRYQTLEETASSLGDVADSPPDVPEYLSEVRCHYTENRERKLTRAGRRDNATGAMSAAAEAIREWADETEQMLAEGEPEEDDDNTEIEQNIADARELADTLEEHVGTAEGCEFPGMRG